MSHIATFLCVGISVKINTFLNFRKAFRLPLVKPLLEQQVGNPCFMTIVILENSYGSLFAASKCRCMVGRGTGFRNGCGYEQFPSPQYFFRNGPTQNQTRDPPMFTSSLSADILQALVLANFSVDCRSFGVRLVKLCYFF